MISKVSIVKVVSSQQAAVKAIEKNAAAVECIKGVGEAALAGAISFAAIADDGLRGLKLLWKASAYAHDTGTDRWHFAVDTKSLCAAGLTACDLRWMIVKGYVESACEIDSPTSRQRAFDKGESFQFTSRTCVVLTNLGIDFVHGGLAETLSPAVWSAVDGDSQRLANAEWDADTAPILPSGSHQLLLPSWDSCRRELSVGLTLVKRFRVPAPNQEYLLTVFQEDEWSTRIDNPFPPHSEIDPKRQLHATISSLNRHQRQQLLDFRGDGTGTGVIWEFHSNGQPAGR